MDVHIEELLCTNKVMAEMAADPQTDAQAQEESLALVQQLSDLSLESYLSEESPCPVEGDAPPPVEAAVSEQDTPLSHNISWAAWLVHRLSRWARRVKGRGGLKSRLQEAEAMRIDVPIDWSGLISIRRSEHLSSSGDDECDGVIQVNTGGDVYFLFITHPDGHESALVCKFHPTAMDTQAEFLAGSLAPQMGVTAPHVRILRK